MKVHIYNIEEAGRRYYRSLEFSSDANFCLHSLPPSPVVIDSRPSLTCGDVTDQLPRSRSLVISRTLTAQMGTQVLVPTRFLHGLLPAALLDEYEFWQNQDSSIYGYCRSDGVGQVKKMLQIEIVRNSDKSASILVYKKNSFICRRLN